jgi:hypothetical protein
MPSFSRLFISSLEVSRAGITPHPIPERKLSARVNARTQKFKPASLTALRSKHAFDNAENGSVRADT